MDGKLRFYLDKKTDNLYIIRSVDNTTLWFDGEDCVLYKVDPIKNNIIRNYTELSQEEAKDIYGEKEPEEFLKNLDKGKIRNLYILTTRTKMRDEQYRK